MTISVFDLFRVGIGPSSSHTVGPMIAAARFAREVTSLTGVDGVTRVRVELFGSLGATGQGHGTPAAVVAGLEGETPDSVDTASMPGRVARATKHGVQLGTTQATGSHPRIDFDPDTDLILHRRRSLPGHPNGLICTAWNGDRVVVERTYYSIGGGFVIAQGEAGPKVQLAEEDLPHPFTTAADLLGQCRDHRLSIPEVMLANELTRRSSDEVRTGLMELWAVMRDCVAAGCAASGVLPGGLKVRRRAGRLARDLAQRPLPPQDPLAGVDWLTLWALAVNEENASGGRMVTAPTNGAAGIIPAVLHYVDRFVDPSEDAVVTFLLTAGAIGSIFAQTASISGAEVGCQGEVGTACAMAAAGFAQVRGGTPAQVANAAEIGLEHHLGMTCDPVGGLVQIPCIERNAVGAIKAITAARLALSGDGVQVVSLDQVIATMVATGRDMSTKYKETARGGLAVNIVEC